MHEKLKKNRNCKIDTRCVFSKSNLKLNFCDVYDYPEFFDYALGVDLNIPFVETLMSIKEFQELYEKYLIEIATSKSFNFDTIRIIIDEFQESYGDEVDYLMLNLDFGYRDLENYLKSKKESVLEQLNSLY